MVVTNNKGATGASNQHPIREEVVRKRVTRKLPKGFERTIIELELQLEKGQGGQELIAMLLSLYSIGVEHFDSVGDLRNATMYREKIQILFAKPIVIQEFMLMVKKASNHQDEMVSKEEGERIVSSRVSTPKQKQIRKRSKSDSQIRSKVSIQTPETPKQVMKEIKVESIQESSESPTPSLTPSPQRRDTIYHIEQIMDQFWERKEQSQVMVQQEQKQQQDMLQVRLMERCQSRQASKKSLNKGSRSTAQMIGANNQQNQLSQFKYEEDTNKEYTEDLKKPFNLGNLNSTNLKNFNFVDFMDEINFISDPFSQVRQLNQSHEIQTSVILSENNSKLSDALSGNQDTYKLRTDEEMISLKGSSKSNQMCSDDIDLAIHHDEYKLAESLAISSFEDKKSIELSSINDKYEVQMSKLKQRALNRKFYSIYTSALTKKLIENLQIEWKESLFKKQTELDEEKSLIISQVVSQFKSKAIVFSSVSKESEEDFLSQQQINVVINDQYIGSKDSSPFKMIDFQNQLFQQQQQ